MFPLGNKNYNIFKSGTSVAPAVHIWMRCVTLDRSKVFSFYAGTIFLRYRHRVKTGTVLPCIYVSIKELSPWTGNCIVMA